mgnify:CR=1 FL=1
MNEKLLLTYYNVFDNINKESNGKERGKKTKRKWKLITREVNNLKITK